MNAHADARTVRAVRAHGQSHLTVPIPLAEELAMSTPNPTLLDKSGTTEGEVTFSLFGKATLAAATSETAPRVEIPAAVKEYLADEAKYLAGRFTRSGEKMTNRFRETLRVSDDLARGILVHRPADLKLTGAKLREAGAKEFARQVRQYALDNKLSTAPARNGNAVTFRLVKPQPAKPAAPVTVTQTAAA